MIYLPSIKKNKLRTMIQKKHYINKEKEDEMEVIGYKRCKWNEVGSWLCTIFSLGFLALLYKWIPKFHLVSTHRKCPIRIADKLLIIERYQKAIIYHVVKVTDVQLAETRYDKCESHLNNAVSEANTEKYGNAVTVYFDDGYSKDLMDCRMIEVKKCKYIWVEEKEKFLKLSGLGPGLKNFQFHQFDFLNGEARHKLKMLYGENDMYVPVQGYLELFMEEATNPYYVYQTMCYLYWLFISYYAYAVAVCLWTFGSIILSINQIHKAQRKLSETVHACDAPFVKTKEKNEEKAVEAVNLVPGDIMVVESNMKSTMPCDAVLLSGTCIVNESMLTGESVPLTKTALPKTEEFFLEREHSMHILYSGTKIIQTRRDESNPVLALVIRTGFSTAKGKLVTSILFPPPVDYSFESGLFTLVYTVAVIGVIATVIVAIIMNLFDKFDDPFAVYVPISLLTIILPAAIPGAMALTKFYVVRRLEQKKIFCINSGIVNVAGTVNCVCFDKTGTLTENDLDVLGVVPAMNGSFQQVVNKPYDLPNSMLKFALSTCHSLSTLDGKIVGDPLDIKMFLSTRWSFEEPQSERIPDTHFPSVRSENGQKKIYILHQNQFMSNLQRMSVVIKHEWSGEMFSYCKGSPEEIVSISDPYSVPKDIATMLETYTSKGYRVIGLGWRKTDDLSFKDLSYLTRNMVENNLTFLGLLLLENKIKPETFDVIQMLKDGQFKIVMITGDNINTAIRVSVDSDIVGAHEDLIEMKVQDNLIWIIKNTGNKKIYLNENDDLEATNEDGNYKLALTGDVWEEIKKRYAHLIPKILVKAAIFARMTSAQKLQVVMELQNLGYSVIMCGDGANDCGALKSANVGVSLSEEEASVASPLTSIEPNISCVPKIIKEGRAGLTSSFGLVKFLMISSWIEFLWSSICAIIFSIPPANQYVYVDVFINIHLSLYLGLTPPYKGNLVSDTPITSLVGLSPIISMIVHCLIMTVFQIISLYMISLFSWAHSPYQEYYQCFAVYSAAIFQFIITIISLSQGYPYIQPLYVNKPFLIGIVVMISLSMFIVLRPGGWVNEIFQFIYVPPNIIYNLTLLGVSCFNLIICLTFEKVFIEKILFKKLKRRNKRGNSMKYIKVEEEADTKEWLNTLINSQEQVTLNENLQCYDNEGFSI